MLKALLVQQFAFARTKAEATAAIDPVTGFNRYQRGLAGHNSTMPPSKTPQDVSRRIRKRTKKPAHTSGLNFRELGSAYDLFGGRNLLKRETDRC